MSYSAYSFSKFAHAVNALKGEKNLTIKKELELFCYTIEMTYSIMTAEQRAAVFQRLAVAFHAMEDNIYEDGYDWLDDMKEKGLTYE